MIETVGSLLGLILVIIVLSGFTNSALKCAICYWSMYWELIRNAELRPHVLNQNLHFNKIS